MPRMRILTPAEQAAFDTPPVFTSVARQRFFHIPESLEALLATLRTPVNQVGFVVTLGYFRAAKRFFAQPFHQVDVDYVTGQLGYLPGLITLDSYAKAVQSRHRTLILDHLGFRPFHAQARQEIAEEIHTMVRSLLRPKTIFLRVLEILESRKTEIPSAYALTALIGTETRRHHRALTDVIATRLAVGDKALLDGLLERPASPGEHAGQVQRFQLTLLKKISQSTRPSRIKGTLEDWQILRTLYQRLEPVLRALDLTPDGVRYYAQAVVKSEIFQVARRTEDDRYLHLLCFIAHQFFRLQDALIDILLTVVQGVLNACHRAYKEQCYTDRMDQRQSLRVLMDCVDQGAFSPLAAIEAIAFSLGLSDAEKVCRIQEVLTQGAAPRRAAQVHLVHLREHMHAPADAGYYAVLAAKSIKLQNRVADIVKRVELEGSAQSPLLTAIQQYKQRDGVVSPTAPLAFLADEEQHAVVEGTGTFRVSLYKALLFVKIAEAIKAGALNVRHSYKYRSLEDYLIPKQTWEAHRDAYLQRADLTEAADWHRTMSTWAAALDQQYHQTNRRLLAGDNPHLHVRKDGTFHVATPKAEVEDAEPLRALFPKHRYISLVEVLSTINRLTHFLDELAHWQVKYTHPKPPERTFLAGIVGYGCFIGIPKIARISTGINTSELEHTVNWYFSLDNVHAANDRILRFMDQLELPEVYRRHPGFLHTSSDGQKFEVAVESLQATSSYKYFGQRKGVSTYTFIDERHFLWHHAVISAAEREAPYVIDGLMHNEVVQSDLHSTDTHGYTEILFGVLHLLGFAFAPRIKHLPAQQLYAFQKRKAYEAQGYKILPDGYINTPVIAAQWEEILRFVATIKLRETTASQLFRRLNSYARQHPLYRALKEFGRIPKSEFVLRYIDGVALRQAIEKQMNKGEHANKFSRTIAFGHNQEFLQGEKIEQEIAEGCRRLIKNAIICWNYLYLSQQIAAAEDASRKEALIAAVRSGSVVAWHHINLHGEYDFSDDKLQDSVGLHAPDTLT